MSGAARNHDAELKHIEEVSKNARTTWFGMLGVLVFSAIAVAGVEDRDFFTYGAETELPLVGVTVPTVPFFVAAPILILAVYIYLHLYLLKLWRGLAALPTTVSVAGERKPLDDAVYPWLLSDAAIHLKPGTQQRPFGWLARLISLLLGWVAGPVVLGMFWFKSWPYHDRWLTLYLAGLIAAAVWIGTLTFIHSRHELRGDPPAGRIVVRLLCANLFALLVVSWMATVGTIPGVLTVPVWSADLRQAEIVARPEDWLSRGEAEEVFLAEYGDVSRSKLDALLTAERGWIDLPEGESLDWLEKARWAFSVQRRNLLLSFDKFDLTGADLRRADLRDAFLPGVRLPGARLGGADMTGAQMEGVVFNDFVNGDFMIADFAGAPCLNSRWDNIRPEPPEILPARAALRCTRLALAHLEGAHLSMVNLSGADLFGIDLSGADLAGINLSGATIKSANLSGALLNQANLSGADLEGADLSRADLRSANLAGANLADLSGAEGLQLEGAIGDDKTILPPHWPTPHVIASCYDRSDEFTLPGQRMSIGFWAPAWQLDEATFRARYVCPEGTAPGRIEGPLGAPAGDAAQ